MKKQKILLVISVLAIICIVSVSLIPSKIHLLSYGKGIKYVYSDDLLSDIIIEGPLFYGMINSFPEEKVKKDEKGNIVEIVETYTVEAKFSMNKTTNLKVHIETGESVTYTYIFKFKDRDIVVTNGRLDEK